MQLSGLFLSRSPLRANRRLLLCSIIIVFASTVVFAQKDTGAIAGTVKDSSAALVADAKVTIADVDIGTGLLTTTNSQAGYVVSQLASDGYNATVEKQG